MAQYEFLIACRDEPEAHRKNEGDIIDIKASPWEWGRKENCRFLIVPVQSSLPLNELKELCEPQRGNGLFFKELPLQLIWDKEGNMLPPMPDDSSPYVAKRRFQIPLGILSGWLPDLDFNRVRDPNDHYQPLKEQNIVIDFFEKVAIVKDKAKGCFKYGRFKTASK